MRNACRDVHDVARGEWMGFAAFELAAGIFAGCGSPLFVAQSAAHDEESFTALHHHDVNDLVMLFGEAIGVAVEQAEAVIAIVGEGFAGGVVGAHSPAKSGFAPLELGRRPEGEAGAFSGEERGKGQGEDKNAHFLAQSEMVMVGPATLDASAAFSTISFAIV